MAKLPEEYDFLTDGNLDQEIKKILLTALLDQKRQAENLQATGKKEGLWRNTPLALALVGTISVFASGLVSYVQTARTASDTVTMTQLQAQLKESEQRSQADRERQLTQFKQQLAEQSSEDEARRVATKDEREFAFKVIQQELAKSSDQTGRAEILLFLTRAGILNSLNRSELEKMATAQIERAGIEFTVAGIPPTLGREEVPFVGMETLNRSKINQYMEETSDRVGRYTVVFLAGSAPLNVKVAPEAFAEKLEHPFVKFTTPNDKRIWINPTAVAKVQANQGLFGPKVAAVVSYDNGMTQGIKEEVSTVRTSLESGGASFAR